MMLTPKQVAERINVSVSLVYAICSEGLLPSYRFGGSAKRGRVLIDEEDLLEFMRRCRRDWKGEIDK